MLVLVIYNCAFIMTSEMLLVLRDPMFCCSLSFGFNSAQIFKKTGSSEYSRQCYINGNKLAVWTVAQCLLGSIVFINVCTLFTYHSVSPQSVILLCYFCLLCTYCTTVHLLHGLCCSSQGFFLFFPVKVFQGSFSLSRQMVSYAERQI